MNSTDRRNPVAATLSRLVPGRGGAATPATAVLTFRDRPYRQLAVALIVAALAYVALRSAQAPEQALQFAFNGLAVGAVYALLAMGFTIVYSTVWFFDLYYGAAAAIGAYGVFYLRSQHILGGQYHVSTPYVDVAFGLLAGGVVAWVLHESFYRRLRTRFGAKRLIAAGALLAAGAGAYVWFVLANPGDLNVVLSPAVGAMAAAAAIWIPHRGYRRWRPDARLAPFYAVAALPATAAGVGVGLLVAASPGTSLYLSWGVSCVLAGAFGLALYRGLYAYMRERSRSPLIMLVASLGILLALTALTTMVFESAPRPLPDPFWSAPWTIAGANIKGFNVFTIGVALVVFVGLLLFLRKTAFGKVVRAIGDDEEVSKVVGINTTVVISIVFFVGAMLAALAGILNGHDTALQPRMGLLLLLKGWIASIVGGIGNLYGAIVGGFVLGMVEQFGIWDLAGEWKDAISFILLILFLSSWPLGLLPRR